jgi:hypothetical protein
MNKTGSPLRIPDRGRSNDDRGPQCGLSTADEDLHVSKHDSEAAMSCFAALLRGLDQSDVFGSHAGDSGHGLHR